MRPKATLQLTLASLGILVTLGLWLWPTDEKRVKEAAEALVAAANGGGPELSRSLETYAAPEVSITVSDLPEPLVGRAAVLAAIKQASMLGQKLHLQAESLEVTLEGKHGRVNADLITSQRPELPELRRPRHSVALFEKSGDHFRLVSAEIGPERLDQPEARP